MSFKAAIVKTTAEQAARDYNTLCKTDNIRSRAGCKAANEFFFEHRIKCVSGSIGMNFPMWVENDHILNLPCYKKMIKFHTDRGAGLLEAQYHAFQLYSGSGSQSVFKPAVARWLYQRYKATAILDFCAGWGTRCIGAMSCGVKYIGIDTNVNLKPAFDSMIATYPHSNDITLMIQDSSTVDYSQLEYDMVLTSPPYFNRKGIVEVYEHMPVYTSRAEFNDKFLFPVIRATYDHLKSGGYYCLNVPQSQYEEVKGLLGEATEKVEYPLQKRTADCKYQEYIYIWRR